MENKKSQSPFNIPCIYSINSDDIILKNKQKKYFQLSHAYISDTTTKTCPKTIRGVQNGKKKKKKKN